MPRTKGELKKTFPVTLPDEKKENLGKMKMGVYSDVKIKEIVTRHKRAKFRESEAADEKIFTLEGQPADRYDVMLYLVALVSEGMNLVDLCNQEGMPTLLEVKRWKKWHATFAKELEEANECRGDRLGEESLSIAAEAPNDYTNAALVKFKAETLAKSAARLNNEYQEKKLIETRDITDNQSYDQLLARYHALVKQFPELATLSDSTGITDAEIITQGEDECDIQEQ